MARPDASTQEPAVRLYAGRTHGPAVPDQCTVGAGGTWNQAGTMSTRLVQVRPA